MLIVLLIVYVILDLYKKIKKAQPPLSLHGQLLWREFFYCAATKNGKFDRMEGNPICVQIPWDTNAEALAKWANVSQVFRFCAKLLKIGANNFIPIKGSNGISMD